MASNGDLDAFNQLVLVYQNLAYCHAYALLRDPALAEDATQEDFLRGFRNIAGFRGGSLRAWIADSTAFVEETLERKEFLEDFCQLLDELPDVFRIVFTLVDIYGLDYAEAASAQNVPIGTVKSRLAQARLQMSKRLPRVENRQFCLYG